ncbi:MAG: aspartate aminotransferase family protein [Candidatus Hydrogenedentota bacterium]|nr:MAG: aspartate aminotransferase family protein [Candidatus Hydrogenedentota bacterium]
MTIPSYRIPGPRSQRIFEEEKKNMSPGLQSFALYSGLAMDRGEGCRLYDADGNEYIDFLAGIAVGSVGHCHPRYVQTLREQMGKLTFGSFTTDIRRKFLNLLASVTPDGLTRIQMFSGGAEAVEASFRLAKSATKKTEFIGFRGAFHGKTGGVLGLLGSDFKHHLGPFMPGLYSAPYAYCYRCPLKAKHPECGLACVEALRDVIRYETQGEIAAIIVEPIQGTAGNIVPPEGFLSAVKEVARENDALLIADEMITGFGRTGKMWGCDEEEIVPDVMTLGKGLGGGFPVSAVVSTEELTASRPFSLPSHSSSSYGGNPLAAAAGWAALSIILDEKLTENASRVGALMLNRLREMQEKYRVIGDVRGRGLLIGIELVRDREAREFLPKKLTRALFHECLRRGLVAMCYNPIIRLNPPLVIDEGTAMEGLERFEASLVAVLKEGAPELL